MPPTDGAYQYMSNGAGAVNNNETSTAEAREEQNIKMVLAAPAGTDPPHVVVVPSPAQGHINPMMHLSRELAAHGVVVTFVNTQFNHERLLQSQAAAGIPLPHDRERSSGTTTHDIRLVGIPDGLGYEDYMVKFDVVKQLQGMIDMEPLLVKLVEDQKHPPVTCIIADVFVACTLAVARRFHIPHIVFWTQNAASYVTHNMIQNSVSLRGKLFLEELEKLISSIPGVPLLKLREVPTFLQPVDPSDFIFNYIIRCFNGALDSQYVLVNTFEELERESVAAMTEPPTLAIGPILPLDFVFSRDAGIMARDDGHDRNGVMGSKNPKATKVGSSLWMEDEVGCIPWLDRQKPNSVLYVSFGSIAKMSALQIEEFANGLDASGWPFLMVLRPELSMGSGTFLATFVDKMRSCGRAAFVEWAPQLEVLAHPAVGGFLTHAGWNSSLESMCMAVPMLCWPYFADQMLNCKCIVHAWKVGLDLDVELDVEEQRQYENGAGDDMYSSTKNNLSITTATSIVRRREIEHKVKQLMDPGLSKDLRERATRLSLAAKQAYTGASRSKLHSLLHFLFTSEIL